eukprot:CAMPEP_0184326518 /NCGR_PEP_ID=MMETSP1049-20130417/142607_1 /TAXON_ID=77928 /ORGANISM="Proteomonas sulcata, Strain CCMP704" /LENGTH=112 /DNA_ID=CAMNT_0026648721 /DNA_START=827 /DNA_END=1165 /DNA_ORIENTATION=+
MTNPLNNGQVIPSKEHLFSQQHQVTFRMTGLQNDLSHPVNCPRALTLKDHLALLQPFPPYLGLVDYALQVWEFCLPLFMVRHIIDMRQPHPLHATQLVDSLSQRPKKPGAIN